MAGNLGAIGEYIGKSFGQGLNSGFQTANNILMKKRQQELQDKYIGNQVANMLIDKYKGSDEYKQAQAQEQALLQQQEQQQGNLDETTSAMDTIKALQGLNTATTNSKNLLSFADINRKKDTAGKILGDSISKLGTQQADTQGQLDTTNTELGKIQNYLNMPLSEEDKRLYDLAMSGNTYATQQIKDMLFPQYDWQILRQDRFDPATQRYYEDTKLVGTDSKGNYITKNIGSNITGEDYTKYKADRELQAEIAKANAKGGDDYNRFPEGTINQIYQKDLALFQQYPGLAEAVIKLNDSGNYGNILPTLDVLRAMPAYKKGWFSDNIEEVQKAMDNPEYKYYRNKVLELSGYDIAYKALEPKIKQIEKEGGQVYINNNGDYVIIGENGKENIASLEDFINFE